MKDNIKQVVKDVRYLIATECNNETIQARIENYIKEQDEILSIPVVIEQSEQLRCKCDNLEKNPLNPSTMRCLDCFNVVTP